MMRLIEVIEGEETSEETLQTAANFAQPIRKTAVRCGEVPGFVVNRILNSAVSEVWRVTEEEGLDVEGGRQGRSRSRARCRWGRSSSPTCSGSTRSSTWPSTCTSRTATASTSRQQMKELVEAGNLGQKTGKGFYEHG